MVVFFVTTPVLRYRAKLRKAKFDRFRRQPTQEMDEAAIKAELDACLLPLPKTGKVDTNAWTTLPDPFPEWRRDAA